MCHTNGLWITKRLLVSVFLPLLLLSGQTKGQEKDPPRPACSSAHCRKIKAFLKAHYCGESPAGNGPDDGCEIRQPKKIGTGIKVIADFDCKWIEGVRKCQQYGRPSSGIRNILVRELKQLGLPAKAAGQIYFAVWESKASGWSLATADYHHSAGSDLTLCQVIVTIHRSSRAQVLRKVRFQKTDADKPTITTWFPIDLADVDGDGHIDVILEGDAYEDHWLEVDSVHDGRPRTIFSGLGYYL